MEYTCPVCEGHKFRFTSAYYLVKDKNTNQKHFLFEHDCYDNSCDGTIYILTDLSFDNRKVITNPDDYVKIV